LLRSTGFRSALYPLDHARATPQNRALVTSGNGFAAAAAAFRLRLGARTCEKAQKSTQTFVV
jgi:hypothetical protein